MINRSLSTILDFKVPKEVWSRVKHAYDHLKPFGCLAYLHTSQGKLNPKAKKSIFLIRYHFGVKGYRIWLLEERKCVINKDVIFNETVFYKANMQDRLREEKDGYVLGETPQLELNPDLTSAGGNQERVDHFVQGGKIDVQNQNVHYDGQEIEEETADSNFEFGGAA